MVVAIGFFDGVHIGHRSIVNTLVTAARNRGVESIVLSFWPHPRMTMQQDAAALRLLSTSKEKREILLSLGVDRYEELVFDSDLQKMGAEQFLREFIIGRFGATALVLGYDNRFGGDGLDNGGICAVAQRLGLEVLRAGKVEYGGAPVSSTRIRAALSGGDVAVAREMLGDSYSLSGIVVEGNHIGRGLGFPTANMSVDSPLKVIPASGVYAVEVKVETIPGVFRGMCNIGVRPTVGDSDTLTIETNIFDFDRDIYGLGISLSFLYKIRSEIKFNSLDLLKRQLIEDKMSCKIF